MYAMMKETLILEAGATDRRYWKDVFGYRDLFIMLVRRDVSVRYKQTIIGILWAVLRPLLTMLVFSFIFGRVARMPSEGLPYALIVFSAMVPWFFFSSSVSESSASLVANSNLLSKVYFPRILLPASTVAVAAVDFIISMILLIFVMTFYGFVPTWRILTVPLFLSIALAAALGVGLWVSTLNARYRDFQFVVPFLLQFGLYLSPVGFLSTVVPEEWALVYGLNPMVGVIDGFRWAILGGQLQLRIDVLSLAVIVAFTMLVSGIIFFRRFERGIADVI